MANKMEEEVDMYGGFDDFNGVYSAQVVRHLKRWSKNLQTIVGDKSFQQAVARSSHGRRPTTGARTSANNSTSTTLRPPTSNGSALGGALRPSTAALRAGNSGGGANHVSGAVPPSRAISRRIDTSAPNAGARPMTGVRAVGFSSAAIPTERPPSGTGNGATLGETTVGSSATSAAEERCKQAEQKIMELLKESVLLGQQRKDSRQALEKAKEAGRRERALVRQREQLGLADSINVDLTFTVLFNLAHHYAANGLLNEALNSYQVIVKNKMFANTARIKVNMGNIHFRKKEYSKAIKYYRMALDALPNVQKEAKMFVLNNTGVAFVRLGQYEEAAAAFEHCIEQNPDFPAASNLVMCAYCLDDADRMRDAFQRLLDVALDDSADPSAPVSASDPLSGAGGGGTPKRRADSLMLSSGADALYAWRRSRRTQAERAILGAARLIAPHIALSFAEGYEWCVDMIRTSNYTWLAAELEMKKAMDELRAGRIGAAKQALKAHAQANNSSATSVSAAHTNLAMIAALEGTADGLAEAERECQLALSADRYSAAALTNQGAAAMIAGRRQDAIRLFREALQNDSNCVQALYNLALCERDAGDVESSLDAFYRLNQLLTNNAQVLVQLASIYESIEDVGQSVELLSQANSVVPSDSSILARLAAIHDKESDRTAAFQHYYDSHRHFPSDLAVIEWLGAYYVDAQFAEKAVAYFERASLLQPTEIRWQLMQASCLRRAGNYQRALALYRHIHRRFPQNVDCLKFLVRLSNDLGLPEAKQYAEALEKADRVRQLRQQRDQDSGHGGRRIGSATSAQSLPLPTTTTAANNSLSAMDMMRPSSELVSSSAAAAVQARLESAQRLLADAEREPFVVAPRDMNATDFSYVLPSKASQSRPKTGQRKNTSMDDWNGDDQPFDDSLLPD